jgi:hypothetical protein
VGQINRWRAYIKPFDAGGAYASEWIEVTKYVVWDDVGTLQQDLENNEYDVGVLRFSAFTMVFRNETGKFSDVDEDSSIFRYKRAGTLVRITYMPAPVEARCGWAFCGDPETAVIVEAETEVFTGLLSDEATTLDLASSKIKFQVLGRESAYQNLSSNSAAFSGSPLVSAALLTLLNRTEVQPYLTVGSAYISVENNVAVGSIAAFENKTAKEVLGDLLLGGNAILYIGSSDTLYVAPRTAGSTVAMTFYGPGSVSGIENIQDIRGIRSGVSRTFNYLTWSDDPTVLASDADSVLQYGVRKKEIGIECFTGSPTRQAILDAIRDEFADPRKELELSCALTPDTLALALLDRVALDYPQVITENYGEIPLVGTAIVDEAILPGALFDFQIDTSTNWNIISRAVLIKEGLMRFKLREI